MMGGKCPMEGECARSKMVQIRPPFFVYLGDWMGGMLVKMRVKI